MQLAPCPYRETRPGRQEMRCRLVQQLLGLATTAECDVEPAACIACAQMRTPDSARLNPVVSSLVYTLSRTIRQRGGRVDCDVGCAWQGECYARLTLAEGPGQYHEPLHGSLPVKRASISRFAHAFARRRQSTTTIGLVGYCTATGLGHLNRDLAENGAIDQWLLIDHPHFATIDLLPMNARITRASNDVKDLFIRRWLRAVDWVVWAETSPLVNLPELARQEKKRVACIPMWEWTSPTDAWLRCVDLLICPTLHAYRLFTDWQQRFGFHWRVAHFPWPISVGKFHYRCRERCRRIAYVNGHGGAWARSFEGERLRGLRKGLDLVLAAAALTPEIPWSVYTQSELNAVPSRNVEVHRESADHGSLYSEGDVCVQPSRWEGIGLPLLECQAAGMPLITVDAAPMNEYHPLRTVTPNRWEWGYVTEGQPIRIPQILPEELASVVRELHGCNLRASSTEAREWIERERSWNGAVKLWRKLFEANE